MNYALAIDIGASSGRHILGWLDNGRLQTREVYRFKNQIHTENGRSCWDHEALFQEILNGLAACKDLDMIPDVMAIDTWGCDYVLLDQDNNPMLPGIAYRDDQHAKSAQNYLAHTGFETLYAINGLQYQPFNTLFQLAEDSRAKEAKTFLMVPDYLSWKLTGKAANEYSNLSTSGLLDLKNKVISPELLKQGDIHPDLFAPIIRAGEPIGTLQDDLADQLGFSLDVLASPSHDTASAYFAALCKDQIILSSGTWSLLGCLLEKPILSDQARQANFTNEAAPDGKIRFLKNIMGLWIIQEAARNLDNQYSFAKLVELAKEDPFEGLFDVNDPRYLKPDNMIETIQQDFASRNLPAPQTPGQIADCIYRSLAKSTADAVCELEAITGRRFETINIIGGGCQNEYLNELIAKKSGKPVIAGPIEATAIGNLLSSLVGIDRENEVAEILKNSFDYKHYPAQSNKRTQETKKK